MEEYLLTFTNYRTKHKNIKIHYHTALFTKTYYSISIAFSPKTPNPPPNSLVQNLVDIHSPNWYT